MHEADLNHETAEAIFQSRGMEIHDETDSYPAHA
jgi:hypothetical protein